MLDCFHMLRVHSNCEDNVQNILLLFILLYYYIITKPKTNTGLIRFLEKHIYFKNILELISEFNLTMLMLYFFLEWNNVLWRCGFLQIA